MMSVAYCTDPYNEIIPGLHVGGHDYQPANCQWPIDAIIENEFDLVISLYRRPGLGHGPAKGVQHLYLKVPDGGLNDVDLAGIRTLADRATEAVRAGKQVLCRCQMGLNRSSLVAAFTLLRLGHGPDEAIALIRAQRSPQALFNTHFQGYIAAEAVRLAGEETTAAEAEPANAVERAEDALQRVARELYRLAEGLGDRGIVLRDGPVHGAPVDTALAELDARRRYIEARGRGLSEFAARECGWPATGLGSVPQDRTRDGVPEVAQANVPR